MSTLPLLYLHLETFVFPLFLAMVLLVQLARAREPGFHTLAGATQLRLLLGAFIVMSAGFGATLYNVSPLLAIELAAGFTLAILHPVNALCLFVHLLFVRPWEIATTNPLLLALPRLSGFICLLSWLIYPGKRPRPNRDAVRAALLLIAFSVWAFLSALQSPNMSAGISDYFGIFSKSVIVFAMCLFFIESERSVVEFELTIVISALAVMVVGFYQFRSEGAAAARLESVGMFGDPNDLAAMVVLALPFALRPVFAAVSELGNRLMGLVYGIFSVAVIWYTQSRGAMLALAAQAVAARYVRKPGQKIFGTLVVAAVLGCGYTVAIHGLKRASEDTEASSQSRITYWKTAINMSIHRPILGVGFGQYPANYDAYSTGTKYEWGQRTAHSSWFLAFAETGVIGGLLFICFFIAVLRVALRHAQRWPAQFCALVGYGVAISFLSETYWLYPYLLAGLILASGSIAKPADDEAPPIAEKSRGN